MQHRRFVDVSGQVVIETLEFKTTQKWSFHSVRVAIVGVR